MKALPIRISTVALVGLCFSLLCNLAQADTLAKISQSGSITLGYRES